MQKRFFIIFCAFLCCAGPLKTQSKELKLVDDLATVLGDKNNSVKKATVQTESEKTLSLQIEFAGFKDKEYKIKAAVLNQLKKPMKEIDVVEVPLDSRSGLADLFFNFKQQAGKQYPLGYAESSFVEISIVEKSGLASNPGLESLGIGAKKFTFQYKKKWRVKGASGQEVTITLVPYKSAANIKPEAGQ
jgi:hypothetical protein